MRHGTLRPLVLLTLLAAGANLALRRLAGTTLLDPSFATGWILAVVVVLVGRPWWLPGSVAEREAWLLRLNLLLLAGMLAAYVGHAGLHWPPGWTERALLVLLVGSAASVLGGRRLLLRGAAPDPGRVRRWLALQTALSAMLVTLTVIHGVFVHAHGLLAHLFL